MIQSRLISLRLPLDLITVILREAHARAASPAEVIRGALRDGLAARDDAVPEDPHPVPLREMAALQEALDRAAGWIDLQQDLRRNGLVLRLGAASARLAVHEWPSNRFMIALDEIGPSLGELVLRYRAPFPGQLSRKGQGAAVIPPPDTPLDTGPCAARADAEPKGAHLPLAHHLAQPGLRPAA